jgi:hypothetical protein
MASDKISAIRTYVIWHGEHFWNVSALQGVGIKKVKQSRYTPWRRLGGEDI